MGIGRARTSFFAHIWRVLFNPYSRSPFFKDDLLLPECWLGRFPKTPLNLNLDFLLWVIKEAQILPKLCLYPDSHLGRPKFGEYTYKSISGAISNN